MVVETCLSKALTDRLTARPLHTRHVTSHDSSSVLFHTSMDGLVGICEYKVKSIKRLEEEEGEEEEKQKLKGEQQFLHPRQFFEKKKCRIDRFCSKIVYDCSQHSF